MVNLGPWAVSDLWRGNSACGELCWASEEAWLGVEGWKAEITGATYEGGPTPGIEIAGATDSLRQIGGVSTGSKVCASNLINQLHSYLHSTRKVEPDAAYQDEMRRG